VPLTVMVYGLLNTFGGAGERNPVPSDEQPTRRRHVARRIRIMIPMVIGWPMRPNWKRLPAVTPEFHTWR